MYESMSKGYYALFADYLKQALFLSTTLIPKTTFMFRCIEFFGEFWEFWTNFATFSVILAFFLKLAHPNGYANEAYPKQKLLLLWSLLLKTKGQIL